MNLEQLRKHIGQQVTVRDTGVVVATGRLEDASERADQQRSIEGGGFWYGTVWDLKIDGAVLTVTAKAEFTFSEPRV